MLADVCKVLDLPNVGQAASRLDFDEKGDITISDVAGRPNRSLVINESGLCSLILASRKPEAKRFKKWVTSEVLPAIRKTGGYGVPAMNLNDHRARECPGRGYFREVASYRVTHTKGPMRWLRYRQP